MSRLFSPISIKDIEFRNRIAVSPMCEYSSVNDGFANDWHLVHLGSRAVGGAGLIMQEATGVSAEGRISPDDLGIYLDGHIKKLKQITDFIHAHGAIAGIQLAHAGRKASHAAPWLGGKQLDSSSGGWQTVSASNIPFTETEEAPIALDKLGIQKVIADFANAAARSLEAGYRVVEIHAAHGYLIHQFLSPLCNNRKDEYGGDFDNRIRLLIDIVEAVQKFWPTGLPLFVRISASDWVEGGWDIDQSVQLSAVLKKMGVDLIDCSSAGMVPYAKIPVAPGYQVPFAERIRKETGILTGAVGMITHAEQAEEILEKGQADMVFLAREFLRDPYFPLHAASILGDDIQWPNQYERAKPVVRMPK
ncbi:MAG: NADH:flavin oxidoreductase/NADH oxidase [Bacteroidetes bacterium]|nr:NADH:flavin oxidoreductase/NADH oxidase [Bacteroidota bacterium]